MTREELLKTAKPILFNTEMVRAILDGRKSCTRRIINPRYRDDEGGFQVVFTCTGEFIRVEKVDENECGIFADGSERYVNSPYQVGDILYVRETWSPVMIAPRRYLYKTHCKESENLLIKWHPSIHMPKQAARIFLRVTGVKVEKLQDIDTKGMCKEGLITVCSNCYHHNGNCEDFQSEMTCKLKSQFIKLWDSTIKKQDIDTYGWNANPWVWVYEFEKCNKPEEI